MTHPYKPGDLVRVRKSDRCVPGYWHTVCLVTSVDHWICIRPFTTPMPLPPDGVWLVKPEDVEFFDDQN